MQHKPAAMTTLPVTIKLNRIPCSESRFLIFIYHFFNTNWTNRHEYVSKLCTATLYYDTLAMSSRFCDLYRKISRNMLN
jgi:hypothetical protein